jgi:hypothetical protein
MNGLIGALRKLVFLFVTLDIPFRLSNNIFNVRYLT